MLRTIVDELRVLSSCKIIITKRVHRTYMVSEKKMFSIVISIKLQSKGTKTDYSSHSINFFAFILLDFIYWSTEISITLLSTKNKCCMSFPQLWSILFSASIFTPTGNRPKCFSSSTFLPPRQVNEKTAKIALTETMPGTCHRLRIPSLVSSRSPRGSNDSEPMTPKKERHRVAMMGAARVGKSSIISQFLYEKYLSRYKQTVEDMHRGEYELPDGSCLTLDILDTSGSYQFPAMRALSINTSGAFILVYAVDDEETWLEVERLRGQVIFEIREIGWG